jgi:hypothetical protein
MFFLEKTRKSMVFGSLPSNMLGIGSFGAFPWVDSLILLFKMKSKKNLTRFTYESAAFEGWRLCISRSGTTFTKYFPDKKFGGARKSLDAAEKALVELKAILESGKKVKGKLSPATIRKGESLLSKL